MSRNILLSFVFHILILMMTGILYSMGNHPVLLVVVILLALIGYITLGYVFLKPMSSVLTNLLSVSLVSSVGLLIGLYGVIFPGQMGFNWMIFLGYHLYGFGLAQAFQFDPGPHGTFWFFALPSLSLWVGLQLKVLGYKSSNSGQISS
ncbi:hypothetical protein [Paenibacillus eucommiae]|uniref:Uncharacterized protein n=1 Tax=Paenibacillus eucommiae TaxID=1355755 RepID=A0ABS4IS84_9BACL|nr:hypothetical protein [Paenibacillus eucommiae]MBP1990437.1 hypothetical protein [Paenibacillus eucommiae]